MKKTVDWKNMKSEPYEVLAEISRRGAAEGSVLLENRGDVLPIKSGEMISLFGRTQIEYYKSGTGSGGQVNVPYKINIVDGIEESGKIKLNRELVDIYLKWIDENPAVTAAVWEDVSWSQEEYVPTDDVLKSAREKTDTAVIVIGRTAGENRDNVPEAGSWYLRESEEKLLEKVSAYFEKTVVLLNTGNIIDMSWVEKYNIKAVMYIWHGGQEGGRAVNDVLCGDVNPSGKLSDTIACHISDYAGMANFGHKETNIYCEDIYVGYRYFETFAKDKVLYPFGYGLSYTSFSTETESVFADEEKIHIRAKIKNTGTCAGREVVQVYFQAPQGKLGKSARELACFAKTGVLNPGQEEVLELSYGITDMSAFDDSGLSGHKNCYVMEAGEYCVYVGNDVRSAECVFTYSQDSLCVTKELSEALAPVVSFDVMYPQKTDDGFVPAYRPVAVSTVDYDALVKEELPQEIPYTGDKGIKLKDVKDGKNTLDEFIAQLDANALMLLIKGEGMRSPKVRPGSTGAFGGLSSGLSKFGIPAVSMHDGPSGIRIDSGEKATGIPIGTALACTWDVELLEELGEAMSIEMCTHQVDAILSPGINIHRVPLNGRNFEYFSEDPHLTGKLAAAFIRGIGEYGNSATVKHLAANSQEFGRLGGDSVVSQRAMREIYLKAFEYAVKEGKTTSIMTSYNKVNGRLTVNDYVLNTKIVRDEWGYEGILVSDWWPIVGYDDEGLIVLSELVKAQNDVYMLTPDAVTYEDDLKRAYEKGKITLSQLQRNARNILKHLMNSHAFERFLENGGQMMKSLTEDINTLEVIESFGAIQNGQELNFESDVLGRCLMRITYSSNEHPTAQIQVEIKLDGVSADGTTAKGTNGEKTVLYRDISIGRKGVVLSLIFPQDQMTIHQLDIMQ